MSIDPPQPGLDSEDDGFLRRTSDAGEAADVTSSVPPTPPTETRHHAPTHPVGPCPRLPKRIGQYHIKSIIASGGMGTVYEAVQEKPRRTVALKVMKHGIASRSALRRFEYESQILARLRHPGIAQVYEAGTHRDDSGTVPYFAMEYIVGAKPITNYASQKQLGTRERMKLFASICDAVHHGHQKGIIHRDLKPGNILVDSHGEVKIIDFGVARGTDSDLAVTTLQTDIGQLIGTLQYMSPEQCEGDPNDIDTRSDVYALGVVLYELLSEKLPYDVRKGGVIEGTRIIREQEPTRLSTLHRALRGDVETIVSKTLEKDRERRYQSADELRRDIEHYLRGEPISARPPSMAYQLKIFTRKNKALVCGVVAVLVVSVVAAIISTNLYFEAKDAKQLVETERDRAIAAEALAESRREEAEQERHEAEQARDEAERERARAKEQRDIAEDRAEKLQRRLYLHSFAVAQREYADNNIRRAKEYLDHCPPDLRSWEWYRLLWLADRSSLTLRGHNDHVHAAVFISGGHRIISLGTGSTLKTWDATAGHELRSHSLETVLPAFTFGGLSRDGQRAATATWDGTLMVWNTATGQEMLRLSWKSGFVRAMGFSPDRDRIAAGNEYGTLRVWNLGTGDEVLTVEVHDGVVSALAFSPDGTRIAAAGTDKVATIKLWNVATGEELLTLTDPRRVYCIAFSPDGKRLVAGLADGSLKEWSTSDGEELLTLGKHERRVSAVAYSPDGTRIVSAGLEKALKLWDTTTGDEIWTLRGHEDFVLVLTFSPDGKRILSGSFDETLKLWDPSARPDPWTLGEHDGWVTAVAFSPDGTRVVSGGVDATVKVWDETTGEELLPFHAGEGQVSAVAWSPDGERIVAGGQDGIIRVWDALDGTKLLTLQGHENWVTSLAFSPDGKHIVSGSWDTTLRLWDIFTGRELMILRRHEAEVSSVAFSPDGRWIVSGSWDSTAKVWDAATGDELQTLKGHENLLTSVAFSPDGKLIASGSNDQTIKVWNARTGEERLTLRGHQDAVSVVEFTPDGQRVISGSHDNTIKIWDAVLGDEMLAFRGNAGDVYTLALSGDGERIVSGGADKKLRVWSTAPRRGVRTSESLGD